MLDNFGIIPLHEIAIFSCTKISDEVFVFWLIIIKITREAEKKSFKGGLHKKLTETGESGLCPVYSTVRKIKQRSKKVIV